jgi:hypothetical protein
MNGGILPNTSFLPRIQYGGPRLLPEAIGYLHHYPLRLKDPGRLEGVELSYTSTPIEDYTSLQDAAVAMPHD